MRIAVLLLCLVGSSALANEPPKEQLTDMGAWDCTGSKPKDVSIAPGDHSYVWKGECSGAEGFDIVMEPATDRDLTRKMTYNEKTKALVLHVTNRGKRTIAVKLHVFVGFA